MKKILETLTDELPKIDELSKYLDEIRKNKEKILDLWLGNNTVKNVLVKHGIDMDIFRNHFANKVLNYFIDVVDGNEKIGNCPVIGAMLIFFKEKNIDLDEVYIICSNLKNSLNRHFISKNNIELHDGINYIFDQNFSGVISEYIEIYYMEGVKNECKLSDTPKKVENIIYKSKNQKSIHQLLLNLLDYEDKLYNVFCSEQFLTEDFLTELYKTLEGYSNILDGFCSFKSLDNPSFKKINDGLLNLIGRIDLDNLDNKTNTELYNKFEILFVNLIKLKKGIFIKENIDTSGSINKTEEIDTLSKKVIDNIKKIGDFINKCGH